MKQDFVSGDRSVLHAIKSGFIIADIPFKDSTYSMSLVIQSNAGPVVKFTPNIYSELLSGLKYERALLSFPK